MDLPISINVFGENYSIQRVSGLSEHGCLGKCSPKDKSISIDSELEGEELVWTIIHEAVHAALEESCAHYLISDEVNEVISDAVGKVIAKNFRLEKK